MKKIIQTHPKAFFIMAVIGGIFIGQLKPIEWIYWKIAEAEIRDLKDKSLSEQSPFESIPKEKWILESENAFVVESDDKEAPFHFLVIPKHRFVNITQVDAQTLTEMFKLVNKVVEKYNVKSDGFRIVINTNPHGAQTVYHLHIHVIAGRQMRWPPG